VIGANATGWTYANRTFVMPAGFPNVELGHRYSIVAPGSGSLYIDNVFFRSLPSPNATNWTQLLPFGSLWRYSVTAAVPTNWMTGEFNDALWAPGFGKFGCGSGPTNILTLLPPQKPAYSFRKTFVAPAAPCEELLLLATCTDGGGKSLELYLNGVKLVTSGVDAVSGQGNEVQYYDLTPFVDLLQPGTNTIAVVLNNVWQPAWDDVAFDLSLKAITRTPSSAAARITSLRRSGSIAQGTAQVDVNVSIPPGAVWRVESSDSLSPPFWQLVDRVTNNAFGPVSFRDTGQNGRPAPAEAAIRFYRLIER